MNNAESIKHKIDMVNRKYKEGNKMEPTSVWKIENIDKIWITQDGDEMSLMLKNRDDLTKIMLSGDAIKNHNEQFVTTLKADIDELRKKNNNLIAENAELKAKLCYKAKSADDIKKLKEQIKKDEKTSTRRDILKAAEKCVCGQREQDYGSPESNFQLIADLWNDYLKKERSSIVVDAMDVAMMMALLKIARIRNGGGSGDSFVDLAGYAACGGEIWHERKTQDN